MAGRQRQKPLSNTERLLRQRAFEGVHPGSNGLAYDTQGRLVLCDEGNRRVARLNADGIKTTLAARFLGSVLYMTASTALYRVKTTTQGAGW